jgi:hypothetical protein
MAKRLALYLGVAGYLLVIWYNGWAFAPVSSDLLRNLLYRGCPMCMDNMGAAWEPICLIRAPINGLMYATFGFLVGKVIVRPGRA